MIHDSYQHVRQFNQFYIMIEYTLDSESNFLETSDRKIAIDQSPLSPYLSDSRELVLQCRLFLDRCLAQKVIDELLMIPLLRFSYSNDQEAYTSNNT